MQNILPFPVGQQSDSGQLAQIVGQRFLSGTTWYRLCRAGAALTANWTIVCTMSAGVPSYTAVSTTTTIGSPDGIGFVPSAYTSGVTSGNYFLLQISGNVTPLLAVSTIVDSLVVRDLGTASVAGYATVLGTSAAPLWNGAGLLAYATNTAAVTPGAAGTAVITGILGKG